MKNIKIRGMRLHNLKNIDLDIPQKKFIAVTGVSGSGKSTAIYDILYQEGCGCYLAAIGFPEKSLSEEPYFDSMEGLIPAVAVEQKLIRSKNPRSVIGTQTKLYDSLKKLYVLEGERYCNECNQRLDETLCCQACGRRYEPLSVRHLSFNSKFGMCTECSGRGYINRLDIQKVIWDETMSVGQICSPDWLFYEIVESVGALVSRHGYFMSTPYGELTEELKHILLYGEGDGNGFTGLYPFLDEKLKKGKVRERIYLSYRTTDDPCASCHGYKLGGNGRSVRINGLHFGEAGDLTIEDLGKSLKEYAGKTEISEEAAKIISGIVKEVEDFRIFHLTYLSLNRVIPSLSGGGELQRLYLMSHLNTRLNSLLFLFDEPTSGLHEADKLPLLDKLIELKENGNTVIVVSHDRALIKKAEHIIDFGPYGGEAGGRVVYEGSYEGLLLDKVNVTGAFLSGRTAVHSKTEYKKFTELTPCISMKNISTNNLDCINVKIPLGMVVGIAGVSGSGKTSLIGRTLVPALHQKYRTADEEENEFETYAAGFGNIEGLYHISGYAEISQKPIGRNRNSNLYTYLDLWTEIRALFASTESAKERKLKKEHFSFNSKGGCSLCKGAGVLENNYYDFGIFTSTCPACKGKRFLPGILEVKYKGKTITDILELSAGQALEFFSDNSEIREALKLMQKIGMDYIIMGQGLPTLSGGEAQRLKLARELLRRKQEKHILYIFDEPTIGLSAYDIKLLLEMIGELVRMEHSVIIIEHDPEVLAYCDYIIELGPKGGTNGGKVIAIGSPEELCSNPESGIRPFLPKGRMQGESWNL